MQPPRAPPSGAPHRRWRAWRPDPARRRGQRRGRGRRRGSPAPRPGLLQRLGVCRPLHMDRLAEHDCAAAERQADRAAVPAVEILAAGIGHGDRHDGPAGELRQRDDAEAGDAGDLGNVGGHGERASALEHVHRRPERLRSAALADLVLPLRAGTAHRGEAQRLHGGGVDLAVPVAGDHHGDLVLGALEERRHQMLAVPHRDDDGLQAVDPLLRVSGLDDEAVRAANERQVAGHGAARAPEDRPRAEELLQHSLNVRRSPDRAAGAYGR